MVTKKHTEYEYHCVQKMKHDTHRKAIYGCLVETPEPYYQEYMDSLNLYIILVVTTGFVKYFLELSKIRQSITK